MKLRTATGQLAIYFVSEAMLQSNVDLHILYSSRQTNELLYIRIYWQEYRDPSSVM